MNKTRALETPVSFQHFDWRSKREFLQDPERKDGLNPANTRSSRITLPTSSAEADTPDDEQWGGPDAKEHHAGD